VGECLTSLCGMGRAEDLNSLLWIGEEVLCYAERPFAEEAVSAQILTSPAILFFQSASC